MFFMAGMSGQKRNDTEVEIPIPKDCMLYLILSVNYIAHSRGAVEYNERAKQSVRVQQEIATQRKHM
jgi:hypothetical protein